MTFDEGLKIVVNYIKNNPYCLFYEQICANSGVTRHWFMANIYTQRVYADQINELLIANRVKLFEKTVANLDQMAEKKPQAAIALIKIVSDEARKRLSAKDYFQDDEKDNQEPLSYYFKTRALEKTTEKIILSRAQKLIDAKCS